MTIQKHKVRIHWLEDETGRSHYVLFIDGVPDHAAPTSFLSTEDYQFRPVTEAEVHHFSKARRNLLNNRDQRRKAAKESRV